MRSCRWTSAVLAAAVVNAEDDVALLRHIGVPAAAAPVPGCLHAMGVGTAVNVHDGGVFLAGVEVGRLHHAPIEDGLAVAGKDGALLEDGLVPLLPGVGSGLQQGALAGLGVRDGTGAGGTPDKVTKNIFMADDFLHFFFVTLRGNKTVQLQK